MKHSTQISSEFDSDDFSVNGVFDFDDAKLISHTGSTCDAYIGSHYQRKVFVKRLKPEFRYDPLYLAAMAKEFELGIGLDHPSLPKYREIHNDFIIMDFIDGHTLSDILSNVHATDLEIMRRWLHDKQNLARFIKQLIEAVGYLHRHNVVHGDIKPDNIILTADSHNLVLIDLDKAYTTWLDHSPGNPEVYSGSRNDVGTVRADYLAIASILNLLLEEGYRLPAMKKLIYACRQPNVDERQLEHLLLPQHHGLVISIIIAIAIAFGAYWAAKIHNYSGTEPILTDQTVISTDSTIVKVDIDTISVAESSILTAQKPSTININSLVETNLTPLLKLLNNNLSLLPDSTLSTKDIIDMLQDFSEAESNALSDCYRQVQKLKQYDDATQSMSDVWHTDAYIRYQATADSIQRLISKELQRRNRQ